MRLSPRLRALLLAPALHFLLLGSAGWILASVVASVSEARRPLRVDAGRIDTLESDYEMLHHRSPADAELAVLMRDWLEEEMLVREARRLGLHRGDLVVYRRLVEKMGLLRSEQEGRDSQGTDLFERALDLGLDRSDSIIRRRLVQRLEQRWIAEAGALRVSEDELGRHLEANAERFRIPRRARVTHAFFPAAGAGESPSGERARTALAIWQHRGISAEAGAARSAPFAHGLHLPLRTERKLADTLGTEAARLALEAPVGRWTGPVTSPWGSHLLFVHERSEGGLPALEVVREQVEREVAARRADELIERKTGELREGLRVVYEGNEARGLADLLDDVANAAEGAPS